MKKKYITPSVYFNYKAFRDIVTLSKADFAESDEDFKNFGDVFS